MGKERSKEQTFLRLLNSTEKPVERPREETRSVTNYIEKRKHRRFQLLDSKVSVTTGSFWTKLGFGRNIAREILDLSEGGAKLAVSNQFPPGTVLYLKLNLPKFKQAISGRGKIRWVRYVKAGEYQVGLQFTSISDEDLNRIRFMHSYFSSPEAQVKRKYS